MPAIRITVGAALEASALKVFEPLERSSERARANIQRNLNAAGQAGARSAQPVLTEWQKVERELEKEAQKILKARERAEKQATKDAQKAAKEAEKAEKEKTAATQKEAARREAIIRRSSEMAGRDAEKAASEEIRAAKRAASEIERDRKRRQLDKPWWARDIGAASGLTGHGGAIGIGRRAGIRVDRGLAAAYGYGGAAVSGALGVGRDILHGIGVETNFSTLVQQSQEQRELATKVSNAGYIPGQNALISPDEILRQAREVGAETGTDTTQALDALRAFVAKTGDLKLGQDAIKNMAVLSKATGSSLEDMADASAEVANHMGDIPNKALAVDAVMRAIAGQGKLGAIEIRDLARQMAKVAATANSFQGGAIKNIATLGVFAQEAKLEGGATSSTMAATSVARFASAMSAKPTLKNWRAHGFQNGAYTDSSLSTLADPLVIVMNALRAASGPGGKGKASEPVLRQLFGSEQALRGVRGWEAVYNRAGGGTEGMKAVKDEFDRLSQAQLDNEEVQRAFKAAMDTSQSQVAIFNNKLQELAGVTAASVIPAFLAVAPTIEGWITSLGNALGTLTGAKRDQAVETLEKTPTVEGDINRINRTATTIQGAGGATKVYSKEAVEIAKTHWAQRNAATAELGTQVADEQKAAKAQGAAATADKFLTFGLGGWLTKKITGQSLQEHANATAAQASGDAAKLEQSLGEQRKATDALGQILRAINDQTAIMKSTGPAPAPHKDGSEAADSPNPP